MSAVEQIIAAGLNGATGGQGAGTTGAASSMAMGANPYLAGAGIVTQLAGTGIQAYLKWKEMKAQKARQKALDFQNNRQNAANMAEYQAGDPIGDARKQNAMDYLTYMKTLKGMP